MGTDIFSTELSEKVKVLIPVLKIFTAYVLHLSGKYVLGNLSP